VLCKPTNTALAFSSIDEIPSKIWEDLSCSKNIYFHPNFLRAIEKNHPKITFYYLVLVDNKSCAKAFASFKIIDFQLRTIKNNFGVLRKISKNLGVVPEKNELRLLVCGNTFVSGEHGVFIKKHENKKAIIKELAESIVHFVKTNKKLNQHIDAFLLKDFAKESLTSTDVFKEFSYHAFSVEPNMQLELQEHWQDFDDYLASIKTKFRVKAKKAFALSADIRIEKVDLKNIDQNLQKMRVLYENVAKNAAFNLGVFNLETYRTLKENFGDDYILKTYWLGEEIVGFVSGVINGDILDAHFVGIDYKRNKTHAIYQRMLYDYLEIAIQKNLKTINFGRTASEIKSGIGAVPQDLTIYIRHKKTIKNKILKLFLHRIKPTPFDQKFPFKK
jgi:predicted N-acyltransferase